MRVQTITALFILLGFALAGCKPKEPAKPKESVQQVQPPPEKRPPAKEEVPKGPPKKQGSHLTRFHDLLTLRAWFSDLGKTYNNIVSTGKPPQNKEDLRKEKINPEMMKLIDDGYVVFIYKVGPLQMPQGSSNTIVAYEFHEDPAALRLVLMGDGSVKEINNDEFKKTPKANDK